MTPIEALRQRDEVLHALLWMIESGWGDRLRLDDLHRLLPMDASELEQRVTELVALGLAECVDDGLYSLSAQGENEARRRLVDAMLELASAHDQEHCSACTGAPEQGAERRTGP